jgi:hypothetical protein
MSNPTRNFMLTADRRVTPVADRWQAFQARLSRDTAATESQPWTRRSAALCDWRVRPVSASAARI